MERITLQTLEAVVAAAPTRAQGMLVERAILLGAFQMVQNPSDAKGPIDTKVYVDCCDYDAEVLKRAVAFFTATSAKVTEKDGFYHVKAKGYRAGPAGDH